DGLVVRTVHATSPVAVDYALTPQGRGHVGEMMPVIRWAEANLGAILAARAAFGDAATAVP
ncbi:transcriptional regulator, partial [Escherichia coli]|nr:transcriptional regulator [Escherichia coli]